MNQVAMTPTTPITPFGGVGVAPNLASYLPAGAHQHLQQILARGGGSSTLDSILSTPQARDLLMYLTVPGVDISGLLHDDGSTTPSAVDYRQAERDQAYRRCLVQLKSEVVQVHALAREASFYAQQLQFDDSTNVEFDVTLRIPARNLSPNYRNLGSLLVEAAVLVKQRECSSQVWSVEKLKSRLLDMRELYEQQQSASVKQAAPQPSLIACSPTKQSGVGVVKKNPFYSPDDNFALIGIANLYLLPLFQRHITYSCRVPVLSQVIKLSVL